MVFDPLQKHPLVSPDLQMVVGWTGPPLTGYTGKDDGRHSAQADQNNDPAEDSPLYKGRPGTCQTHDQTDRQDDHLLGGESKRSPILFLRTQVMPEQGREKSCMKFHRQEPRRNRIGGHEVSPSHLQVFETETPVNPRRMPTKLKEKISRFIGRVQRSLALERHRRSPLSDVPVCK